MSNSAVTYFTSCFLINFWISNIAFISLYSIVSTAQVLFEFWNYSLEITNSIILFGVYKLPRYFFLVPLFYLYMLVAWCSELRSYLPFLLYSYKLVNNSRLKGLVTCFSSYYRAAFPFSRLLKDKRKEHLASWLLHTHMTIPTAKLLSPCNYSPVQQALAAM